MFTSLALLAGFFGLSGFCVAQNPQVAVKETSPVVSVGGEAAGADLLDDTPPNPQPGECYIRVRRPAVYETIHERILVQPSEERIVITPAVYKKEMRDVLIKPATRRLEIVPAKFEKRMKKVEVQPARQNLIELPPEWETYTERIMIEPERIYWKRGDELLSEVENPAGDLMCLIKEPAVYDTIVRKRLVAPAKIHRIDVPAEYMEMEETVLIQPETVREHVVPAVYKKVEVEVLVTPTQTKKIKPQPRYEVVKRQQQVSPSKLVWSRVLCKTNVSPTLITRMQHALARADFDPGKKRGDLNQQTMQAVEGYQRANNLATGGLTYEFLEHIGVLEH